MSKGISSINQSIGICKAIFQSIIRRINIDEVDLTTMRLFQQFQCSKVIPFKKEIHLPAVVNEQICILGQHWRVGVQHLVNFLPMLLEYETVLLSIYIFFEFG